MDHLENTKVRGRCVLLVADSLTALVPPLGAAPWRFAIELDRLCARRDCCLYHVCLVPCAVPRASCLVVCRSVVFRAVCYVI